LDADEVKEEPSEIIMKRIRGPKESDIKNKMNQDEIKNIYEL